jgi:hypothetical protein
VTRGVKGARGAGIGKNLNVGGDISIQNELYILKQQLEQANY